MAFYFTAEWYFNAAHQSTDLDRNLGIVSPIRKCFPAPIMLSPTDVVRSLRDCLSYSEYLALPFR